MKLQIVYYWLLLISALVFTSWYFISKNESKPLRKLAYFGPKNGVKINDTTYHTVPSFNFTDQFNEKVTEQTVANKVYVTEFFFTTCQSICPVMNKNLELVYKEFDKEPDFMILSHTVDPEIDSVSVMMEYARQHGVRDKKWLFLTGEKPELYRLARTGYLLNAEEGDGGPDDFIHTQNFALVDKDRHIRGFYAGTDTAEVSRLIREIKMLLQEHNYEKVDHL